MSELVYKFMEIRDIKYQIPLNAKAPNYCCSGKMKLFKRWLDKNGYLSAKQDMTDARMKFCSITVKGRNYNAKTI